MEAAGAEALMSTQAVARALNMELVEMEGWSCCGATHAQDLEPELALVMNARNLALAERMELPMLTICSTCSLVLNRAMTACNAMDDETLERNINRYLVPTGLRYGRKVTTTTLLREMYLRRDVLAERCRGALSGMNIAAFYGCHTLYSGGENPLAPTSLEELICALGASPVLIPSRLQCCGFHGIYPAREAAVKLASAIAEQAREARVDAVVTPCPLCQMQIDMYQKAHVAVLHLPQLIGMALGLPEKTLGLHRNLNPLTQ